MILTGSVKFQTLAFCVGDLRAVTKVTLQHHREAVHPIELVCNCLNYSFALPEPPLFPIYLFEKQLFTTSDYFETQSELLI